MAQRHGHLEKKTLNVSLYKILRCGSGVRRKRSAGQQVSNEEVFSLVQEQRSLIQVIKQRQANWIGHILRHDCLLKTVLEGMMEGKRPKGKPRRKMLDLLMEQKEKKISYEELKRGAQSRVGWCHRHWNLP